MIALAARPRGVIELLDSLPALRCHASRQRIQAFGLSEEFRVIALLPA
jgi:hypothetical protein